MSNALALFVGNLLGVNPLISMMTEYSMTGGHGNHSDFAQLQWARMPRQWK